MYLEKISQPSDMKKYTMEELNILAQEMRELLLKKMSIRGGHFASNFGMVETTIALHYVFDSPKDKFIFDVSHQSYCHKMLTGRKDAFLYEEHYNDVSGYTCPDESTHDLFNIGHTATSISLACGLAKIRDLIGGKENIIAIIGDASMGGGEAMEALNFAWELHSNMIVVLNDNAMSIAENHGGLYRHLEFLRKTKGMHPCNFFCALGWDYHFVEDGHDIEKLTSVFKSVKDIDHPTLIHICTEKGKGYAPAEKDRENWHWRPPFHIEDGSLRNAFVGETYDTIARDYLLGKMKEDPTVVTLVAGVPLCLRFTADKREEAGAQFVDVGIAEEHAITMAAGITKAGGKPVFATDCTFFQRAYDQIAQDVCINCCPVTMLVRNASVFGMRDITHLGIFDIPLLSNIPNLVYLAPTNKDEYIAMLNWSLEQNKYPVAIRVPKNEFISAKLPVDANYDQLNRYQVTQKGSKIAIIALGNFYQLGEKTTELIYEKMKIKATLINPRYITGIDEKILKELEAQHDIIITLEDGILDGGFGEKITRFYGTSSVKVLNYGLRKEFLDRYSVSDVLLNNHLTPQQISEDVASVMTFDVERKRRYRDEENIDSSSLLQ